MTIESTPFKPFKRLKSQGQQGSYTSQRANPIPTSRGNPPVYNINPVLSGSPSVGNTLTSTTGTWTSTHTITYNYQWQRNGSDVIGETNPTYVVRPADVGARLRCLVLAANIDGQAYAYSNTLTGTALDPTLTVVTIPTLAGSVVEGQTLFATDGTYSVIPDSVTRTWKLDGVVIGGQTADNLVLIDSYVGGVIGYSEVAHKSGYTDSASNPAVPTVAVGLPALTLTLTSPANTNPPTFDSSLGDLDDGDSLELYYTTNGSTPTATGSPQGTHTADAREETINWGAGWPLSFASGVTVKWGVRYGRVVGGVTIWAPISNVLTDVMPVLIWNPNVAPAGQNISAQTATFANENFLTGLGIVFVSSDNGQPSGVTVGGTSATLVKTSNGTGVRSLSIWKVATTAGAKNVVVSSVAFMAGVAINTGTLLGMNSTETATAALAYGFGGDPQTTGSLTCPSGGVILAGLMAGSDTNVPTWTIGTPDCDVAVTGRLRHTSAHLSTTGAPTLTGFNFSGSGMAAAAWGP